MPRLALQHPEEDRSRPPPRACQGPVNPSINSSNPAWSRRVPGSVPLINEVGPPRFPDPCGTQRPSPAWRKVSPGGWVAETPGRVLIGWWCPRGGGDQAQRRGRDGGGGGGAEGAGARMRLPARLRSGVPTSIDLGDWGGARQGARVSFCPPEPREETVGSRTGLLTRRRHALAAFLAGGRGQWAAGEARSGGLRPLGRQEGHVGEEQAGCPGSRRGLRAETAEETEAQRKGSACWAGASEPWAHAGLGCRAFAPRSRAGARRCGQLGLQAQQVGDGEAPGARAGGWASGHQRPASGTPVGKRVSAGHGFSSGEAGPSGPSLSRRGRSSESALYNRAPGGLQSARRGRVTPGTPRHGDATCPPPFGRRPPSCGPLRQHPLLSPLQSSPLPTPRRFSARVVPSLNL